MKGKGLAEQVARAARSGSPAMQPIVPGDPPAKQSSRAGKKGFTVYLDPPMHRELRQLALDLDCSAEAIVIDALAGKLASHRGQQ